ncbi:hypothetical protein VPH35_131040 [Triticum aestivum]
MLLLLCSSTPPLVNAAALVLLHSSPDSQQAPCPPSQRYPKLFDQLKLQKKLMSTMTHSKILRGGQQRARIQHGNMHSGQILTRDCCCNVICAASKLPLDLVG